MNAEKIKISIVNYTNTLPFKWSIKRSKLFSSIDLQEDIPSQCAEKLKTNLVDLALVPVALLPELERYTIETDFCIGANGRVDSVKLYSAVPLNEIETVTLDYQSKSSITLARILFQFFWKHKVNFIAASSGYEAEIENKKAGVVIGDRTFALNGKYAFEYDLANEWKQFTGLPFVFAAWVSVNRLNNYFVKEFNDVLKYGVENIEQAIDEDYSEIHYSKAQVTDYLMNRINYNLNAEKQKALNLFLTYIERLKNQ